jgi:hypothetical protein
MFQTIQEFDKEIIKFASSSSLQPRFAIIGDISSDKYAVQITDKRFEASGIIDGFIETFKVFCALKFDYPPLASLPWTFVQQAIFDCKTDLDNNRPVLIGLLNNLNAVTPEHIEKFDSTFSTTYLKE